MKGKILINKQKTQKTINEDAIIKHTLLTTLLHKFL